MSDEQALIRPATDGRTIGVVGDVYRFMATGRETDGRYAVWEAVVPPGGGPPPHVHSREAESFYVLEGEVQFQVGDERFPAPAGTFAHLPIGSLHAFKNVGTQTARMIITVVPAGLEEMFFEVGTPVYGSATSVAPPTPAEIERLLAAAPRYGVAIPPPSHG